MKNYEKIMRGYNKAQNQFEQMIIRFDEDISLKASKLSLQEMMKDIERDYLTKVEIEKQETNLHQRIDKKGE